MNFRKIKSVFLVLAILAGSLALNSCANGIYTNTPVEVYLFNDFRTWGISDRLGMEIVTIPYDPWYQRYVLSTENEKRKFRFYRIPKRYFEPCYTKNSYLPETGPITATMFFRARRRDGEVIDMCAEKFEDLSTQTKKLQDSIRARRK